MADTCVCKPEPQDDLQQILEIESKGTRMTLFKAIEAEKKLDAPK